MKKYFFLAVLAMVCSFSQVSAQTPGKETSKETGVWDKVTHDFGNVPQNVPVSVTFKVKNTSKTPFVISSVNAQCGCTTPSYSKDPIMSGKSGEVKAQFNAANLGAFTKTVTVTTNDPKNPTIVLTLKGTVVEAKNPATTPK